MLSVSLSSLKFADILWCTALWKGLPLHMNEWGWGLGFDWTFETPDSYLLHVISSHVAVGLLVFLDHSSIWSNFSQSLAAGQTASHLPADNVGIGRVNGWLSDCQESRFWSCKTNPKSSPLHHHVWHLAWSVCVVMLVLFFHQTRDYA